MLQWAHNNGCPWDEETTTGAADHGHVEVLLWALDNGCPFDHDVVRVALKRHQ
jgi:hypothetical protein